MPTKIGPLIRPPSGALETGLKELEPGEEWAVMPRLHVDDNPHLVSPGVKWGVQPSSFTHCTELFGPVLGVMEARDLDEAIELVNATGYGLTSGLESLDDREQELWRETNSRRQSVHQPADDGGDRAAATVRRHGQEQRRAGDQGGRAELCRAVDGIRRRRRRRGGWSRVSTRPTTCRKLVSLAKSRHQLAELQAASQKDCRLSRNDV